jgi:hypothetical protein
LAQQALRQRRLAQTSNLEHQNQELMEVYNFNVAGIQHENALLREMLTSLVSETHLLIQHVTAMDNHRMQFPTLSRIQQHGVPPPFPMKPVPHFDQSPAVPKRGKHSEDDSIGRRRKYQTSSPGSSEQQSPRTSHAATNHSPHNAHMMNMQPAFESALFGTAPLDPIRPEFESPPFAAKTPFDPIRFEEVAAFTPLPLDPMEPQVVFEAIAQKLLDQHGVTRDDERHLEAALSLAGAADQHREVYLPANNPSPYQTKTEKDYPNEHSAKDLETPSAYLNFATPVAEELTYYPPVAGSPKMEVTSPTSSVFTPVDTIGLPPRLARCVDSLPCKEMQLKMLMLKQLGVVDVDFLCEELRRLARCRGNPRELASWSVPKGFFKVFPDLRIEGLRERD